MRWYKYILVVLTAVPFMGMSSLQSIQEMSLEEKIGQLLIVHFHGESANEDAKTLIQTVHVAGFIYYNWANGLHSPQQVRELSHGLQKIAEANRLPIPLYIAVDQEGGPVARLTQGFTLFPSNQAVGLSQNPYLAKDNALAMGTEMSAVGINLNLAPVVDINSNPKNPIIGPRSFGETPDIVISFAKCALDGYHQADIMTTLKHFPGHGDVSVDSHIDLPVLKKSKAELEKMELLPFIALAGHTEMIMTAHILVEGLDPEHCTTLSKPSLDYLRQQIGFKGVIVSDSLVMEGVLKNGLSVDEAAIRAVEAGCDLLILGGKQLIGSEISLELNTADVQRIHHALCDAERKGRLSMERIDEAVQRNLDLKRRW